MTKKANELIYAIANCGADAFIVENEEQAEGLTELINGATSCREITDEEEFRIVAGQLDFSEQVLPRRLFSFVNGSEFVVCFPEDYGD